MAPWGSALAAGPEDLSLLSGPCSVSSTYVMVHTISIPRRSDARLAFLDIRHKCMQSIPTDKSKCKDKQKPSIKFTIVKSGYVLTWHNLSSN